MVSPEEVALSKSVRSSMKFVKASELLELDVPDVAEVVLVELVPLLLVSVDEDGGGPGGGGGGAIDWRSCSTELAAVCAVVISPDWTAEISEVRSVMN